MTITREIPDHGDDAVVDRAADEIKSRAKALGFSLKHDDDDADDYVFVLTNIATGDQPLGAGPVSASDVEKFLDEIAADLGDDADNEVDTNSHLKKRRPPKGAVKQADAILRASKPDTLDDDPDLERIIHNNARVIRERQISRTNVSTAIDDAEADADYGHDRDRGRYDADDDFLPPESGEYDPAPKAAAGFAVVSKTGRLSSAEMARRKMLLTELRAALAEEPRDPIKIGRYLFSAKELVGHGGFEQWVELLLPARTAQSYIMAAKKVQL